MDKEILIDTFKNSLKELYKNDYHLIENETSERSIVATLACYLKQSGVFSDYKIDVEYNREGYGNNPKKDMSGNATTADLIIHKTRGDKINGNLLYLESKTHFNNKKNKEEKDIEAIKYLLGKFKYKYGFFLCFGLKDVRYKLFYLGGEENNDFDVF